jgi:hypothetical protein
VRAQQDTPPAELAGTAEQPGFGSRGRARRRARFLRRARELAYRDLGGLVYNLHRFGQRNDALVLAKLNTLGQIDGQLRALELALAEREPVTVLREAGITACARCAAIHSSEDRFCPNCGLSMARHVELPIAGAAAATPAGGAPRGEPPTGAPRGEPPTGAPAPAAAAAATPAAATPAANDASAPLTGAHAPVAAQPAPPSTGVHAASAPSAARPHGAESTEILRPPTPGS